MDGEQIPRLLTIWFPHWPVLAARDPAAGPADDIPVAVLRGNRVLAVSPVAEADGVRIGHRRREAQACCPGLQLIADDPERDARRFEPVVRSVGTLVPLLEVSEPGWLTFATRGPSRYAGGDQALAERAAALALAGYDDLLTASREGAGTAQRSPVPTIRHGDASVAPPGAASREGAGKAQRSPVPTIRHGVGVAGGRFAAAVAARHAAAIGRVVVVPPGQEASARFLAPFPLRALHDVGGLPIELVELLRRLGLRRLGQLAEFDGADLLARFGPDGAAAHRFARAVDARPTTVTAPPPELALTRLFDEPVSQIESLVFLARQLAAELHASLAGRGLVATRLLVEAETEHGERTERAWYRPVGLSAAAMVERVRWQLDGWVRQPGRLTGGVVLLRLAPTEVRPDAGDQRGFWGGQTQADEWALRATTRLAGLLGHEAVTVPEWLGGRAPSVHALVPAGVSDLSDPSARTAALAPPTPAQPWPGRLPAPSPACVLDRPEPCELLDAAGEQLRVGGRGLVSAEPVTLVTGRSRQRVIAWAGPWPIEERWWDARRSTRRARIQLVVDGDDALLVSVANGCWQIDARYR